MTIMVMAMAISMTINVCTADTFCFLLQWCRVVVSLLLPLHPLLNVLLFDLDIGVGL
jgi:hypothetical protein